MPAPILELRAENYRCLDDVRVPLGPLNVLVGPNGGGKSTLLDTLQFLGDAVRDDLLPAVEARGGFEALRFRGREHAQVGLGIKAVVTEFALPTSPDEYMLRVRMTTGRRSKLQLLRRDEEFRFKRTRGAGRRLTVRGAKLTMLDDKGREIQLPAGLGLHRQSLALSTLPRVEFRPGGDQVNRIAELFRTFRVFDVKVAAARGPALVAGQSTLRGDAANLSAFLAFLHEKHEDTFRRLERDARDLIPGLRALHFRPVGGAEKAVVAEIEEVPLPGKTPLAYASYGTIRLLAVLALLYDPSPPLLTCMEEIDHGLHPHVFDRLVELLRDASQRTQLILATHSPALVNRLRAEEIIVCERRDNGGCRIPAIDPADVKNMMDAVAPEVGLGELWFSGTLGGVP